MYLCELSLKSFLFISKRAIKGRMTTMRSQMDFILLEIAKILKRLGLRPLSTRLEPSLTFVVLTQMEILLAPLFHRKEKSGTQHTSYSFVPAFPEVDSSQLPRFTQTAPSKDAQINSVMTLRLQLLLRAWTI